MASDLNRAPAMSDRLAGAFGSPRAVAGLRELYDRLDAPRSGRALGFDRSKIPAAGELILPLVPATNPRSVTLDDLRAILDSAWSGSRGSF